MKAVIFAGGLGTRLAEETSVRPKPMVEVGGHPMLWHIMSIYSHFGINEFVVCLGYKGYMIKEYFAHYAMHNADLTVDLRDGSQTIHRSPTLPWKVTLVDTGADAGTACRLSRVKQYIGNETLCLTYGDGVADVDIPALLRQHKENQTLATVTAIQPPGRWGNIAMDGNKAMHFQEKPDGDGTWINGGFFVLEPKALEYCTNDESMMWEQYPLKQLAADGQLGIYRHSGFWMAMDTLRDKQKLEELWAKGAPWAVWDKPQLRQAA